MPVRSRQEEGEPVRADHARECEACEPDAKGPSGGGNHAGSVAEVEKADKELGLIGRGKPQVSCIAERKRSEREAMVLSHGVGKIYQSPLPLELYLLGAAATVLISFVLRVRHESLAPSPEESVIFSERTSSAILMFFKWVGVSLISLILIFAILNPDAGLSTAPLLFWLVLIITTIIGCSVLGGLWERANPWRTLEDWYSVTDREQPKQITPPWWLGPVFVYLLFWFELVSGKGFDPLVIVIVLLAYTLLVMSLRPRMVESWGFIDPLSIIFDFASRIAPLRIHRDVIVRQHPVRALASDHTIEKSLFFSVFILLASTTLDNVRETVEWSTFLRETNLGQLPTGVIDSAALVMMTLPFFIPFIAALALARRWFDTSVGLFTLARRFAWSLIPIGIAYVLAHNMPLLISGGPILIDQIGEQVGLDLIGSFIPSPQLVWFLEIALIVGGHVLGVLIAHAIAIRLTESNRDAMKAHAPLTLLMSFYTVSTLWLLSLPLVAS